MKMYDLNKAGYSSLPPLTTEETDRAVRRIANYIKEKKETYYMLLNHDIHYFTLFKKQSMHPVEIAEEILDLLREFTIIKAVEISENKEMMEIWTTHTMSGEGLMFGLFGYDRGVITL